MCEQYEYQYEVNKHPPEVSFFSHIQVVGFFSFCSIIFSSQLEAMTANYLKHKDKRVFNFNLDGMENTVHSHRRGTSQYRFSASDLEI